MANTLRMRRKFTLGSTHELLYAQSLRVSPLLQVPIVFAIAQALVVVAPFFPLFGALTGFVVYRARWSRA